MTSTKIHRIAFTVLMICASDMVGAGEAERLREECVDLGFKMGTTENSKCALKLMKKLQSKEDEARAEQDRDREALLRQQEYFSARQHQAEMEALGRQQARAQEEVASAARTNNMLNIISNYQRSMDNIYNQQMQNARSLYTPPVTTNCHPTLGGSYSCTTQ